MNGYIIHFATYIFAMIGFIALALFIYKKSTATCVNPEKKDFLKVENSLKLSATKTIYVIKAGNEEFLIAGDTANTTLLAKLENENNFQYQPSELKINNIKEFQTPILKKMAQKINRG